MGSDLKGSQKLENLKEELTELRAEVDKQVARQIGGFNVDTYSVWKNLTDERKEACIRLLKKASIVEFNSIRFHKKPLLFAFTLISAIWIPGLIDFYQRKRLLGIVKFVLISSCLMPFLSSTRGQVSLETWIVIIGFLLYIYELGYKLLKPSLQLKKYRAGLLLDLLKKEAKDDTDLEKEDIPKELLREKELEEKTSELAGNISIGILVPTLSVICFPVFLVSILETLTSFISFLADSIPPLAAILIPPSGLVLLSP